MCFVTQNVGPDKFLSCVTVIREALPEHKFDVMADHKQYGYKSKHTSVLYNDLLPPRH